MNLAGGRRLATLVLGAAVVVAAAGYGVAARPTAGPTAGSTGVAAASRVVPGSPAAVGSVATPERGPAHRARAVQRPEAPVAVTLPGARVVPVRAVGTTSAGRLAVPGDIRTAGWWRGGSRIGDPFGTTVIAAHVDSAAQGLGPFADLLTVRPGQPVRLLSARYEQRFEVTSLSLVPRESLERNGWIFATDGGRRLILVTCAPPYAAVGGYQNLAVVTATPISAPRARRA